MRDAIGVLGNRSLPVILGREKSQMRAFLEGKGFEKIKFKLCKSVEDAFRFFDEGNTSFILKPETGVGSSGVYHITSKKQIQPSWTKSKLYFNEKETKEFYQRHGRKPALVAEEFLEGREFSIETISYKDQHQVLGITEYLKVNAQFVEVINCHPANLTPSEKEKIDTYAINFLKTIEHYMGPAHIEVKLTKSGVRLIEANIRPGGGYPPKLIQYATGINVFAATIDSILSDKLDLVPSTSGLIACCKQLQADKEGGLVKIEGEEAARALPQVVEVHIPTKIGDKCLPMSTNGKSLGYVISVAKDYKTAIESVNSAVRKINLVIE